MKLIGLIEKAVEKREINRLFDKEFYDINDNIDYHKKRLDKAIKERRVLGKNPDTEFNVKYHRRNLQEWKTKSIKLKKRQVIVLQELTKKYKSRKKRKIKL